MSEKTSRLRLSEKLLKDVRCGYLYANGKLVLVHETAHPKAGTVEWATIHDTGIGCAFTGRIVLHRTGPVRLTLTALRVQATAPAVEHGSENTKRRNIAVGSIALTLGPQCYQDAVYIQIIDGLASDWCYQPELVWTEQETPSRWAGYNVAQEAR
jgi:hypothetical protein